MPHVGSDILNIPVFIKENIVIEHCQLSTETLIHARRIELAGIKLTCNGRIFVQANSSFLAVLSSANQTTQVSFPDQYWFALSSSICDVNYLI